MNYFRFPESMQNFIHCESSKILPCIFKAELKKAGLTYLKHTILRTTNDKIYIKCNDCDWMLNYHWNKYGDDSCSLHRFVLYHKHPEAEEKSNVPKHEAMESLYRMGYRLPRIQSYLQYKCGVEPGTTHNLYYKYRYFIEESHIPTFQNWYRANRGNVTIMCYPPALSINYNPSIVFVTCKFALNIHKERGQITGIKIMPNKISELTDRLDSFICVMFYGILANQNRVLYAYAMFSEERQSNLYKVLKLFLKVTGSTCESFFTDDEFEIKQIIQVLKKEGIFVGEHYLDPSNYIRSIENQKIRHMMFNLLKTKTEEEYQQLFKGYNKELCLGGKTELHEEIEVQKQRYCIWMKKKVTFMGNWFLKSGLKYHRMLVDSINVKRSYTHMLMKIEKKFAQQRISYEKRCEVLIDNTIIENSVPFEWIKTYRSAMYREGFREFMKRVYRTSFVDCEQIAEEVWRMKDGEKQYKIIRLKESKEVKNIMTQAYQQEEKKMATSRIEKKKQDEKKTMEEKKQAEDKKAEYQPYYECSCNQIILKGLPCSHIIKILLLKQYSFMPYINNYWRLKKDFELLKEYSFYEKGLELPKRGRPKQSKRNTQKHSHLKS